MFDTLVSWKEAAPAAGALIAIISALVALIVFTYTRNANRRRATLDMVMKTLLDSHSQERYSAYKNIIRRDKSATDSFKLESLIEPTEANHEDREIVLTQLNIYEMTSLGIRRKLFEEDFYKRWFHNQFMTDYENASAFVLAAQAKKGSVYCEYASLYRRWDRSGHPVSNPNQLKMAWWGLTKQNGKIDQARDWAKAR